MTGGYTLTALGSPTGLLDLPFDTPLEEWDDPRLVVVPRGISRHVVRFVRIQNDILAIKEEPERLALHEHALLRELAARNVPVVDAFGTVTGRATGPGAGLIITKHLSFSLPYRALFAGRPLLDVRMRLLDALVELLVRLHLAGFYWGDCSLSNTLFRRDAGALAAYLVDAETGEWHPKLSTGQRTYDVELASTNLAGELFDLQAAGRLADDIDPVEVALELQPRYEGLWHELNSEEVVARDESYRIDQRIRRLNKLGFDVEQFAIASQDSGQSLRFVTQVVEPGHHQRRLLDLTGLRVQPNQARHLLADLVRFRAKWADGVGHDVAEDLAARKWLDEKYYATLSLVPGQMRGKIPDPELFHEILEHRWFLSQQSGVDVGRTAAVNSYVEAVLKDLPDTRIAGPEAAATGEFTIFGG